MALTVLNAAAKVVAVKVADPLEDGVWSEQWEYRFVKDGITYHGWTAYDRPADATDEVVHNDHVGQINTAYTLAGE